VVQPDESAPERDPVFALEDAIGHSFRDRSLLVRALTHSSYANEADPKTGVLDNETLEFLGDSVLGFLVAELLFRSRPNWGQGLLTKARAEFVSEAALADKGRSLGLGAVLRLSAAEDRAGGRDRDGRLADAFEALVAAVFLDAGLDAARGLVERVFAGEALALEPEELSLRDAKSALQERAQAEGKPLPRYRLLSETGPDHAKWFVYEVRYGAPEELAATGEGPSKKEAQREAAGAALAALDHLSAKDG
jgi:ribonuclease-3